MSAATLFNVPLKWISLITLTLQNSTLILTMRYVRTLPGPKFIISTAVVLNEFLKLFICLAIYINEERTKYDVTPMIILTNMFGKDSGWLKMTVPAILYFIQNNLQYTAATLLDAATFQVTYQLKIITTAIFSVLLLNKKLSASQWMSLLILTIGIALVQLPTNAIQTPSDADDEDSSSYFNRLLGLVTVLSACVLSGLAGVWYISSFIFLFNGPIFKNDVNLTKM